jgi:DNA mismatch repair ATPase MutS
MSLDKIKTRAIFLISFTILIAITSVIVASELNATFYLLLLITIPLIYLAFKQFQKLSKTKLILKLRGEWGVSSSRLHDFSELEAQFRKDQAGIDNKYALDDRTWNDLDMDSVYAQIDSTLTNPGERILYSILKSPLMDEEELTSRNRLTDLFFHNQDIREKFQVALSRLGKTEDVSNIDILWEDQPPPNKLAFLYKYLLFLIPLFIVLGILGYSHAWLGLGAVIICNMVIHYRTKEKIYEYLASIRYLGKLIRCAINITDIKHPAMESDRQEIEQALSKVSYITKKTSMLGREAESFYIYEYLNIIFLFEVRAFYSICHALEKYESQLKQVFTTIGFIDAIIAVASYRAGLKSFTEPILSSSESYLKIEELVHPLLKKPIPNSLSIEKGGVLVTGSNMSGKTTLLKAIGINAVLAQTIYTCHAKAYHASYFHIMTLIGRRDNVIEGKSYYLDEIHALLRIINALEKNTPCLCLLDEIFRGTNSLERISASAEVLLYLARHNCLIFVSTHDLELTELVESTFRNFHFLEKISEDGISFNYKLMNGPSTTRNAIQLLRHVGYPKEIVTASEARVRETIKGE